MDAPIPPDSTAPPEVTGGRGGRRAWWIGGGAVALLGVGAGAWAALGFFQQGAQPAEALPSTTVAYLSIDLDPAGGQKIDAFRTLNKFPAFKDQVGVDSVDELRHKIGEELVGQADCPGLDYDRDIDPWLGDRMAVAGVELDGDPDPQVVAVLQVKDEGQAREGIKKLNACDDSGEEPAVGFHDGWAVFAENQKNVDAVLAATDKGTLADDATYQKWTKAVGEAGVVNAYASPEAGRALARQLGGLFSGGVPTLEGATSVQSAVPAAYHVTTADDSGDDPFTKALSSFKGGAATLRFTSDGLEFAAAADGGTPQLAEVTGNTGGTLVQRLPGDTAAAAGVSLPKGWLDRQLDQMSSMFGGMGMSKDDVVRELSQETGLDVPADIQTLLGSGLSISDRSRLRLRGRRQLAGRQRTSDRSDRQGRLRRDRAGAGQDPRSGGRPGLPRLGHPGRPRGDRPVRGLPAAGAPRWRPRRQQHLHECRAGRRRCELAVLRERRCPGAVDHQGCRGRPGDRRQRQAAAGASGSRHGTTTA